LNTDLRAVEKERIHQRQLWEKRNEEYMPEYPVPVAVGACERLVGVRMPGEFSFEVEKRKCYGV